MPETRSLTQRQMLKLFSALTMEEQLEAITMIAAAFGKSSREKKS